MTKSKEEFLLDDKRRILDALVDLITRGRSPIDAARLRTEADNLIAQLAAIDTLLSVRTFTGTGRFANYDRTIDAVVAYLTEVGTPLELDHIIDAVRDAGLPKSKGAISRSIGLFIAGPGMSEDPKAARLLKKINGRIGLIEWDDSLFEPSR